MFLPQKTNTIECKQLTNSINNRQTPEIALPPRTLVALRVNTLGFSISACLPVDGRFRPVAVVYAALLDRLPFGQRLALHVQALHDSRLRQKRPRHRVSGTPATDCQRGVNSSSRYWTVW